MTRPGAKQRLDHSLQEALGPAWESSEDRQHSRESLGHARTAPETWSWATHPALGQSQASCHQWSWSLLEQMKPLPQSLSIQVSMGTQNSIVAPRMTRCNAKIPQLQGTRLSNAKTRLWLPFPCSAQDPLVNFGEHRLGFSSLAQGILTSPSIARIYQIAEVHCTKLL